MDIKITEIQRFCMHDGPGVRTVVFTNGCPLSCAWCHNPEGRFLGNFITYDKAKCIMCGACASVGCGAHIFGEDGHIFDRSKCVRCGKCTALCPSSSLESTLKTVKTCDVIAEVLKDMPFYGDEGGMTVSGGEPMFRPDATLELLTLAKSAGINTAVETCGFFEPEYLPSLVGVTDTFLWDIKDTDDCRHKKNTGVSNARILSNLAEADRLGAKIRLRCIMIASVNMTDEHALRLADIASSLKGYAGIDFIPYHPMGESKYARLGMTYGFGGKEYIPSKESIELFKATFNKAMNERTKL